MTSYSLPEWLERLENRHQQPIQLGLSRVKVVAQRLDLISNPAKKILVAGTNGKGSTVAALASIYLAAGYQVGTYTSPHLIDFNERITINNQPISDESLCFAFNLIEQAREDIVLTYFEVVTLAALWYFKQTPLDILLIEVGMGGRLDATNIIDADLAIITTIDLDHQAYLGDTRELIAIEKAGILRANTPMIYADFYIPSTLITSARKLNAPMTVLSKSESSEHSSYSIHLQENGLELSIHNKHTMQLPLPGVHFKAAAAAVVAVQHLQHALPVSDERCRQGVLNAFILGRQQVFPGVISTVCDVAHNPQSARLLSEFLTHRFANQTIHAVFSGLSDKDLRGVIHPMRSCVAHWYPCLLAGARAVSAEQLLSVIQAELGTPYSHCFDSPVHAYNAALQRANEGDVIVVYGSFLTVSPIAKFLGDTHDI